MKRFVPFVIFALVLISPVLGIGIGPGMVTLEYSPGKVEKVQMIALNQVDIEQTYSASSSAEHITCEPATMIIPDQAQQKFTCTVRIPKLELPPGVHEIGRVRLTETAPPGVGIGAVGAVVSVFRVNIHNPGPYLSAGLSIDNVPQGNEASGTLSVQNIGTDPLSAMEGSLVILDSAENFVSAAPPYAVDALAVGESHSLPVRLPTQTLQSGQYRAVAEIPYAGKKARADALFRIGEKRIRIGDLAPVTIDPGGVAKLTLETESFWSEPIEYYIDFIVRQNGQEVFSVRENLERLLPWATEQIPLYWETGENPPGVYDVLITLRYGDRSEQREFSQLITVQGGKESAEVKITWPIMALMAAGVLIIFMIIMRPFRKNP